MSLGFSPWENVAHSHRLSTSELGTNRQNSLECESEAVALATANGRPNVFFYTAWHPEPPGRFHRPKRSPLVSRETPLLWDTLRCP